MSKMFNQSELKEFNDFNDSLVLTSNNGVQDKDLDKFLTLHIAFHHHKEACKALGVLGVGCYTTFKND
tara:strand:- start:218 stop:421 length:204 start_codon:yes stop_codon:yes gene_type:complete